MPRWIRTRDLNRRAATETYIVFCLVWQPRWVRVSSGRVISPITDRHPCLGRIRTHDLSGRAAALTDIIFYLAWQPPVCQDLLIHTRLLWTSDQPANRLTSITCWNLNPRSQRERSLWPKQYFIWFDRPSRSRLPHSHTHTHTHTHTHNGSSGRVINPILYLMWCYSFRWARDSSFTHDSSERVISPILYFIWCYSFLWVRGSFTHDSCGRVISLITDT